MLSFPALDEIHLPSARGKCPCVLAPHSEQDKLCHISEVEPDAAAVRPAVFSDPCAKRYSICT